MSRRFTIAREAEEEILDWGRLRWLSHPPSTNAEQLTVIDVILAPGKGHDFHKHPDQEEVIYIVAGTVEQWVDREKRILGPGDSAHIPADMVHASFNVGDGEAKVTAILGPCVGDNGYELIDVADEEPWTSLRR
ncbi:cupin domain-containing protein [Bauldia sp.]|uniref:cupin domain-containing protein n=1 Tax=Bauldia sp. TaxID=2575872 RepID=UPI003BAB540F